MTTILAIGGGGFLMEPSPSPIDKLVASFARKRSGRVCFIGTASGDLPAHIDSFYETYDGLGCKCSHLAFFRKQSRNSIRLHEIEPAIADQDVIYVGGGNTKAALSVWREWGVDAILQRALDRGTVLAGMSAGAMCWFEEGFSDSFGEDHMSVIEGLGYLPGSCCAHFNTTSTKLLLHIRHLDIGRRNSWIGIDDGAAVLYQNARLTQVLSWRHGAKVYHIDRELQINALQEGEQ